MANEMSLAEAAEYLKMSQERVILLVEAHEISGEQHEQEWKLDLASLVAYKARKQAEENAWQGVEDDLNPLEDKTVS